MLIALCGCSALVSNEDNKVDVGGGVQLHIQHRR
jgi:hypothetical protein